MPQLTVVQKMNYTAFEHRHRFAVWAGARAAQRSFTSIENLRAALEQTSIVTFAENKQSIGTSHAYDIKHKEWCNSIVEFLARKGIKNATYGRAAKLVAVYLKAMVVLESIDSEQSKFIHPPIDRILLQNISKMEGVDRRAKEKLRTTSWTQLNEASYFELLAILREINGAQPLWKLEEYWTVTEYKKNDRLKIENARLDKFGEFTVTLSGHNFSLGQNKYTILELGWAVYLAEDKIESAWMEKFGEHRPAQDGVSEFSSHDGMLFTSHPILVALALRSWWHRNGRSIETAPVVRIPTMEDAIEEVRKRKILNPWNRKWASIVPGLHHASMHNKAG